MGKTSSPWREEDFKGGIFYRPLEKKEEPVTSIETAEPKTAEWLKLFLQAKNSDENFKRLKSVAFQADFIVLQVNLFALSPNRVEEEGEDGGVPRVRDADSRLALGPAP